MGHEEEEGRFVTTMMSIKVMVMTIVYHGTTVCLTKHHERAGDRYNHPPLSLAVGCQSHTNFWKHSDHLAVLYQISDKYLQDRRRSPGSKQRGLNNWRGRLGAAELWKSNNWGTE